MGQKNAVRQKGKEKETTAKYTSRGAENTHTHIHAMLPKWMKANIVTRGEKKEEYDGEAEEEEHTALYRMKFIRKTKNHRAAKQAIARERCNTPVYKNSSNIPLFLL